MANIKFFDENTKRFASIFIRTHHSQACSLGSNSWWTPLTGGANIPALNDLLGAFGIAFGDKVFAGTVSARTLFSIASAVAHSSFNLRVLVVSMCRAFGRSKWTGTRRISARARRSRASPKAAIWCVRSFARWLRHVLSVRGIVFISCVFVCSCRRCCSRCRPRWTRKRAHRPDPSTCCRFWCEAFAVFCYLVTIVCRAR